MTSDTLRTSLHTLQWLPSVRPSVVQVAAMAGVSMTLTCWQGTTGVTVSFASSVTNRVMSLSAML